MLCQLCWRTSVPEQIILQLIDQVLNIFYVFWCFNFIMCCSMYSAFDNCFGRPESFISMLHFSAGDPHVQYSAVSSFVFLRFFAVAVLSPHTFQLRSHHPVSACPWHHTSMFHKYTGRHICIWLTVHFVMICFLWFKDPEISRTLTLISKTIQTLGSWGSLSKKLVRLTVKMINSVQPVKAKHYS